MRLKILLTLILVAVLSACHSVKLPSHILPEGKPTESLADAKKALAQATPCCTSFADFSYQKQLPWHPQEFTLGDGSPVATISNTHTYFLAFSLPPEAKLPYKLAIKSELQGRSVGKDSYLFGPTVVLLNSAFQPVDTQDISLCEYMGWSNSDSGAFGSVEVKDKDARYVVIYSSDKQQTGNTYWEQSAGTFSTDNNTTPSATTTGGSYKIQHGPNGTIWFGMMDKNYSVAVTKAVCGKPPQGNGVLSSLPIFGRSSAP